MWRTLIALTMLAAGSSAAHADLLEAARAARDLAVSSLDRLEAITEPTSDPLALAEQLRLEVHVPLGSYYASLDRYEGYEGADVLVFQACFMEVTIEVNRFDTEVEYALKSGKPLPEMTNRADYIAALERCNTALKTATKP